MDVDPEIKKYLVLVDDVLSEIEQVPLIKNKNFMHHELSYSSYIRVELKKSGSPDFFIIIDSYGIEIGLDRVAEAYEWTSGDLDNDPVSFKKILKEILTYKIIIKHVGSKITKLKFINN